MIRPFTLVCFLLACGSGLYLYSEKHRVQLIDREIEKTVRGTEELREQSRVLHAEWTLQNDPQRLQALADQFLSLKTVTPSQFTNLAGLDARLPAVPAPEPPASEPAEPQPVPVAQAPQSAEPVPVPPAAVAVPSPRPAAAATATAAPPPARPVATVAVAAPPPRSPEQPARPPEHKSPPHPAVAEVQPRPVVTEARPSPIVAHRPVVAEAQRPAAPTPMPTAGSALGMAHSAPVPPPRPMPVSASQWVTGGGGG